MLKLQAVWPKLLPFRREPEIDRYRVKVVTVPEELARTDELPIEIRYALAVRPSRVEAFRTLLEQGYGIGVRIVDKTPERVLKAVDRISRETQENTIVPWLEHLLRHEEFPIFSKEELERCEAKGVNLYEEAKVIIEQRFEFVKVVIVDLHNKGVGASAQELIRDVNTDLYPLAIDTIVHRVIFDNAHTRTEIAQSIIKALVIIGPIAHVLEHFLSGLGKVFAACTDDLLAEAAELFALHGSGFTWRQLVRRSRILVVVFAVAVYASFQVDPLIHAGRPGLAGLLFGFSAVALSLTTAIQSIGLYKRSFEKLIASGKLRLREGSGLMRLALRQDFTNPARMGLFAGALVSPVCAAATFVAFPSLESNGWVLAALGSVESIVAGLAVMSAFRIERLIFRAKVKNAMRDIVAGDARHGA